MRGHVRRRGSRWCVVLNEPKAEGERRRQRWFSGFATKREAVKALNDIMAKQADGTYVEPDRVMLADYLEQWIEGQESQLRPSTFRSYHAVVHKMIMPRLGGKLLQRLTAADLNAFYATLLREGGTARNGSPLSPRTVRYAHTILRKALKDAVRQQRVARNAADMADPPSVRASARPQMKTWTANELRRFLDHVENDRLAALWTLAATTGMRRGELLGVRWIDLDFNNARLAVTQTLLSIGNKTTFGTPKTNRSRRSISLDTTTSDVLRAHRKRQLAERLKLGLGQPDADALVFTEADGSPLHPDRISTAFQRHIKEAELPRIRLHDLRHTHASLSLAAGVHPKVVSERLGHASVTITLDTYSHTVPALQEEAAEKVAALVFG